MSTLPLFPNIGIPELLLTLVIILIVFGAGKLPQIGKALGEGIKGFRDGTRAEDEKGKAGQIEAEADDDPDQRIRTKQRPDNHRETR